VVALAFIASEGGFWMSEPGIWIDEHDAESDVLDLGFDCVVADLLLNRRSRTFHSVVLSLQHSDREEDKHHRLWEM
jgi:hypothetical protein